MNSDNSLGAADCGRTNARGAPKFALLSVGRELAVNCSAGIFDSLEVSSEISLLPVLNCVILDLESHNISECNPLHGSQMGRWALGELCPGSLTA